MYRTPIVGLFDHKHPGKRRPPLSRRGVTSKENTGAPNDALSCTPDYAADDAASDNSATTWSPRKVRITAHAKTVASFEWEIGVTDHFRLWTLREMVDTSAQRRENFYELYRKVDRQRSTTNDIIEYIPEKDQYAQLEKFMDEDTLAVDETSCLGHHIGSLFSTTGICKTPVMRGTKARVYSRSTHPEAAVTGEINLSHVLGDVPMKIFAEVLDLMPNLRVLNVRDNRLTDASIETLVYAVCHPGAPDRGCGALESLDLSENDLDMKSVVQLPIFRGRSDSGAPRLFQSRYRRLKR